MSMKRFVLNYYFQKKFGAFFKINKNVGLLRQNVTYIVVTYIMEFSSVQIPFFIPKFYSTERYIFGCMLSKQKRRSAKAKTIHESWSSHIIQDSM